MSRIASVAAVVASVMFLSACASNPNLVGIHGNHQNTQYSLQDQRIARTEIKVEKTVPAGATAMGPLSVERCHQYATAEPPTDATMLDDLVLAAYGKGADGIANPRFARESALFKNCWFLVRGTAELFKLPTQAPRPEN